MKQWLIIAALLFGAIGAKAQTTDTIEGFCDLGATSAQVSGLGSTNKLQGIIPGCTITVYLTGTQTLATIYADGTGTPLSNPFTATVTTSGETPGGHWIFWAADQIGYDVVGSGGTAPNNYPSPITLCTDCKVGGGGSTVAVCGVANDIQNNNGAGGLGCDTGIGQLVPSSHTIFENILNGNQEVQVSDQTHTGIACWGHSNGTNVDYTYCTGPSSTYGATYGTFKSDAAPTQVGQSLVVKSTTPVVVTLPNGLMVPMYPMQFGAPNGAVSLENLPYIYTDTGCNSPSTCGDLVPIPVPYSANNFYAGPRVTTGGVGYLTNTVTAGTNAGGATSAVLTLPYPTNTGDPLVLVTGQNAGGANTPTDSCGNTWVATVKRLCMVCSQLCQMYSH